LHFIISYHKDFNYTGGIKENTTNLNKGGNGYDSGNHSSITNVE
jgi:hypothetical protein